MITHKLTFTAEWTGNGYQCNLQNQIVAKMSPKEYIDRTLHIGEQFSKLMAEQLHENLQDIKKQTINPNNN